MSELKSIISLVAPRNWLVFLLTGLSACALAQEDFETAYNRLKTKIESELRQPPASTNDLNLYLTWMAIKAKDRDECEKLSYKAGREGNPYWERKFFDLSDEGGNYKIEGALLHKSCGPFLITANGEGCYKQEEVPGPLEEPDKSYELEKNLLLECGPEGYTGTITLTKSWDYTKHYRDYSSTYTGSQTITVSGIFKPLPQTEGMEGQPVKIYGGGAVHGQWKHNSRRYCEGSGCGDCKGLVYEEYGSGSISKLTMDHALLMTNVWPTDNKVVADQLAQFGMENWYDIMIPVEPVETQCRTRSDTRDAGCQWDNSTSSEPLTDCSIRYKLKNINLLQGRESWSSKSDSQGISVTNLTEAIYDQPPYDPEQNGTDFTYTITWNLKAL